MARETPALGPARGLGAFLPIWLGQTVSLIGSGLTGFALSVWLFQQTGNATPMALTALSQWVPRIVLAPVAGIVADRYSRKAVIALSDTGAAIATAVGAFLVATGRLEVWHVYLIAAAAGTAGAFQAPAFTASVTLLVDKRHYARASGMRQASDALEAIAVPVMAGMLLGVVGLVGIIVIDLATFVVAVSTVLAVRIPNPPRPASAEDEADLRGLRAALYGLRYIGARRGLLAMLLYFAVVNFVANTAGVLLAPMVLSFSDARGLGLVQMVSGISMLGGSVLISVWGGPERKMLAVYFALAVSALGFVVAGLNASVLVVSCGVALMFVLIPVGSGSAVAIWPSLSRSTPPSAASSTGSIGMSCSRIMASTMARLVL